MPRTAPRACTALLPLLSLASAACAGGHPAGNPPADDAGRAVDCATLCAPHPTAVALTLAPDASMPVTTDGSAATTDGAVAPADGCPGECADASTPPPTDSGTPPTDSGTPPTDSGMQASDAGSPDAGASDALPAFDTETQAHVRMLIARGAAMGNRPNVFAKIGDSMSESASFMFDCGYGWYMLGAHGDLEPTIQYFSAVGLGDMRNSFNRASVAARGGWTTEDNLATSPTATELELTAIHPQFALVMYGTNDIDHYSVDQFQTNMGRILDIIEAHGVVAAISTIPDRMDGLASAPLVPAVNNAIRTMAHNRHLPLWDFNVAMAPLPNHGASSDGIHPSIYMSNACYFTPEALRYGYNVRNLLAVQMLARLRTYNP